MTAVGVAPCQCFSPGANQTTSPGGTGRTISNQTEPVSLCFGRMAGMNDLGFVRANLPLVEEKLRSRGMDPAAVLGDFAAVDLQRREAITQFETLKARRNKLTEEIAKLRRSGGDATALTEETKSLKAESESLEF